VNRLAAAVAVMTFREAVRDRILYLLLAFALIMIAAARFLALLTVGSEARIVADTGLAAIAFFGVLTAIFVGVSLISKEIEQRTAYTVLARPMGRGTFVVGKYLGLLMTLWVNAGIMSLGFILLLTLRGEPILPVLPALWLIAVELAVVTALALFFSSVATSSIIGVLFTLGLYAAGHLVWSFPLLAQRLGPGWGQRMVMGVYYILPNLDRFNVRALVIHGDPVPAGFVALQTAYGAGWAVLLLLAAARAFGRRDLT